MRRVIYLLLLIFLIFQLAYAGISIADPNEWDFSRVKQGEVLKHDFIFKNETKDVLNITGINTSCGCTVSQSDKKSLKPGEVTAIKVSFNSHGYLGEVKQFIYVNTDSAVLPIVKFTIKTEVVKKL